MNKVIVLFKIKN